MRCRHCGAKLSLPFLDLGSAPPSNAYLDDADLRSAETWFPLRLLVCEQCWLVQTEDHAGRELLFSDRYAYFSSFSASWLRHSQAYVDTMIERLRLDASSLVAEVAANDGYLLQFVARAGIPCYGIEPTASTAAAARGRGIEIVQEFFGDGLAQRLAGEGRSADLLAANNVLAHVPDVGDFVRGFARLLKPHGVATFEFPHLLQMIRQGQFDTAYHEHYSYLSLGTVLTIFRACGLAVFDVEQLPTHGGSLRVFAQRSDTGSRPTGARVREVLDEESRAHLRAPEGYLGFQARAQRIKDDFVSFLIDVKREGKVVAAYGAAAKGNTLMNFGGVRPDLLRFVADANPAKQGRYMPGSRIPIAPESQLRETRPDFIVLLPWNLKDELMAQLSYARGWGARFVTAVPHLEIA
jgi:SAM-dependent methyltransferase